MKLEDEILVNKYGQGLIVIAQLTNEFSLLNWSQKKSFLNDILYLIMQSKPKEADIELAINESRLKTTYTPCVLLRKGIDNHHLMKIVELPEAELSKAFVLLLGLFKVAYKRRFDVERDNPDKWWYWDLSDSRKVEMIINHVVTKPGKSG